MDFTVQPPIKFHSALHHLKSWQTKQIKYGTNVLVLELHHKMCGSRMVRKDNLYDS